LNSVWEARIRRLIRTYVVSLHAAEEMEDDDITIFDPEALSSLDTIEKPMK
jgi:hypothetical protein